MPALCLVLRLKRVAAYVAPHRRVEGRILAERLVDPLPGTLIDHARQRSIASFGGRRRK
jgi:hypothetical protein